MANLSPSWMEGLNEQQIQAVNHGEQPLLILAGAGSGKTRVITSRIACMVGEKGFNPYSILALTFTNKAAQEMRERVTLLESAAEQTMIRTFHSFGAWFLRRNATAAKLSPSFTIYDDDDQVSLLASLLGNLPRRELRIWANRIARAKDEGLSPDDDLSDFSRDPDFPDVFQRYEKRLREIGNVDFGDLILLPIKLLQNRPEIRSRVQQRFRVILVDEYQDTNLAQYQLLRELTGLETWLGVVGDDDQSIYRFRGAKVENILEFPKMFPGTRVIKLEQNYRSTGTILDIASAVVSNNTGRLGKNLWTAGNRGEKALVAYLEDHEQEAEWCVKRIMTSANFGSTAILYRTNAQSRIFETTFRRRNIPYRIVGTLSFYQREEIRDVLAYLSWITNTRDEVAFRRMANKPTRGLGKKSIEVLLSESLSYHLGDILKACEEGTLKGKAAKGIALLKELHDRYAKALSHTSEFENLGFLVQDLIIKSELLNHYKEVDRVESSQRTENLDELINAASAYQASKEGLTTFLELVELDRSILEEEEESENCVTLITMHNTKGLEFDSVIITGLEEGLFPRGDEGFDDDETEEERRLFYVAITRARKLLAMTSCRRRMIRGRFCESHPSRFLQELPPESIRIEGQRPSSRLQNDSWFPGTRLYHEDYGLGVIQKRLVNNGNTAIHVLFESGRNITILPEFSLHKLEFLGVVEDRFQGI